MSRARHTSPEPFRVAVEEAALQDLQRRLEGARWADDVGNEDAAFGAPRAWLQPLVEYWRDAFDWRAQERALNAHPQFTVEIDGVPIHYLHVEGRGPDPTPLILTHGWPCTVLDWWPVIGPLTDPAAHGGDPADAFTLVVPSLPGAGFSTPLPVTGVGVRRTADLWAVLMRDVLGYDRFAASGTSWGSNVAGELGHGYPEHVLGVLMTLPNFPGARTWEIREEDFAPDEAWMWRRWQEALPTITSHSTVHRIEPQTLAYALVDSPLATAAWLWGHRALWTDDEGDPRAAFARDPLSVLDPDALCASACVHWLTGSIGTSIRMYHDHYRTGGPPEPRHDRTRTIDVPTAFAVFPRDLMFIPRRIAEERTDLRRWTVMPRGGHYPATEHPDGLVDELRTFLRPLRG